MRTGTFGRIPSALARRAGQPDDASKVVCLPFDGKGHRRADGCGTRRGEVVRPLPEVVHFNGIGVLRSIGTAVTLFFGEPSISRSE